MATWEGPKVLIGMPPHHQQGFHLHLLTPIGVASTQTTQIHRESEGTDGSEHRKETCFGFKCKKSTCAGSRGPGRRHWWPEGPWLQPTWSRVPLSLERRRSLLSRLTMQASRRTISILISSFFSSSSRICFRYLSFSIRHCEYWV